MSNFPIRQEIKYFLSFLIILLILQFFDRQELANFRLKIHYLEYGVEP